MKSFTLDCEPNTPRWARLTGPLIVYVMKPAFIAAVLFAVAHKLGGTTFSASYVFDDQYSLTAQFSGNLNGNLITGIRDLSVNVAGSWWDMNEGPECLTWERSYTYDGANHLTEGDAIMTLDGSFMNFCFGTFNEVDEGTDWWDWNVRWAAHTDTGMTAIYHYQAGSNWTWDASRWSVEVYEEQTLAFSRFLAVTPSRVPDGGSVAVMMALALAGMAAVKRRIAP